MPAKNPKHDKYKIQQMRMKQYAKKKRRFRISKGNAVVFLLIVSVVVSIVVGLTSPLGNNTTENPSVEVVEDGDFVVLEYKLWVADVAGPEGKIDSSTEPFQEGTIRKTFEKGVFIDAFYYNVLGMHEGETKYFNVKYNEGYTSGELANKALLFWVRIIDVVKANETESSAPSSSYLRIPNYSSYYSPDIIMI